MTVLQSTARARALLSLGTAITPALIEATGRLCAPGAPQPDPALSRITRDLVYGPHQRNRLDVFAPADALSCAVVVFVHGGGFVTGDKGGEHDPFYNNFGAWAITSGIIGVTINYRLAPAAKWPSGSEDLALAIGWLQANIASYGGDPGRIFVMGHSAGAVHVADYLVRPDLSAQREVAGAVMVSGIFDLLSWRQTPLEDAYYGTDREMFAAQSTLPRLAEIGLPCLYAVAEFDPPSFQLQAARVVAEYASRHGGFPRMLYLSHNNHLSSVMSIGSEGDYLSAELLSFVNRCAAKA